ncbi:MAG TPA: dihydrolipoamide acetyltransferase family protein [Trebonia sp.]|jgi:pyruvate dehydrogenase E2 component (dihydrolipoamide acetyltransferase)
MPDFLLPDLGEGLDEAEVVSWRVKPGDRVAVDQVIAEVETAKAVVEVPVPYAGTVAALHAEPGSVVSVGQPLITVTADEPTAAFREPGVVTPSGDQDSGSVLVGYGTDLHAGAASARGRRGRRRGAAGAIPVDAPPADMPRPRLAGPAAPATADPPGRVAVISPIVRKEAKDAGLDLTALAGTGPAGVISRRDVRRAIAERTTRPQRPVPAFTPDVGTPDVGTPDVGTPDAGAGARAAERRIPLRGARRAAADKLSRSRREIPEATVWVDVDATGLVETRRALNAADAARPVSLLALLARFAVLGLRRYPELNARIEQDEIIVPERVNLGFAAQTDHGLVVPVVHDAHRLTTRDLSARLAERTAAARERRLAPADLADGTFTVNNYGIFGVDGSAAIINHPEVAILGMGRVIDRPWVVDGELAVRKITELTLSFDHRACDGGTAGGFLRYVADCIESPATALGDM